MQGPAIRTQINYHVPPLLLGILSNSEWSKTGLKVEVIKPGICPSLGHFIWHISGENELCRHRAHAKRMVTVKSKGDQRDMADSQQTKSDR